MLSRTTGSGESGSSYREVMDLKKEKIKLAGIWSLTRGPVEEAAKICTLKNVRICGTSATILFSSKNAPAQSSILATFRTVRKWVSLFVIFRLSKNFSCSQVKMGPQKQAFRGHQWSRTQVHSGAEWYQRWQVWRMLPTTKKCFSAKKEYIEGFCKQKRISW